LFVHISDNSKSITGYTKEEWLQGGLPLYAQITCKADVYENDCENNAVT
jgi:hypothetical protein